MKCPVCGSTLVTKNEKGEIHCKKCGYVNSKIKRPERIVYGSK